MDRTLAFSSYQKLLGRVGRSRGGGIVRDEGASEQPSIIQEARGEGGCFNPGGPSLRAHILQHVCVSIDLHAAAACLIRVAGAPSAELTAPL